MAGMTSEFDDLLARTRGNTEFGAQINPQTAANGARSAATAAPAAASARGTILGNMAAKIPTLAPGMAKVGGVLGAAGRYALPVVGAATAIGLEGMRVADVANDPATSKIDVATAGAEGVSRLAGGVAGAGLGAAGGSALGPIGTVVGGALGGAAGYFAPDAVYALRDYWRGKTNATPAAPTPQVGGALPIPQQSPGQADQDLANAQVGGAQAGVLSGPAPVVPFTANDIRNTNRVPVSGTGAFVNSRGEVTNLDTRSGGAEAAAPAYRARTASGAFYQAGAQLKQIADDNAQRNTGNKLLLDLYLKGSEAQKHMTDAQIGQARLELARQLAGKGDTYGAAAATSGRAPSPQDHSVVIPGIPGATGAMGQDKVVDKVEGTYKVPAQKVTREQWNQDVAALKKTPAEVKKMYEAKGLNTSDLK